MNKKKNKLIPDLRFPEFMDEWEEEIVSKLVEYENGKAHEQDIVEQGKFVVVNSKFISTDGEVRKFSNTANCLAKKNEILMVLSDVPNGRAIAKCFYVDEDNFYTVNQRICKLTPTKAEGKLLFYLLNRNPYFLSFDDGVKQTNLKNEDVLNCPLRLPKDPNEQKKIASCLSSLDEVLAAHTQKLEQLKNHKKGLMQNLFPQEGKTVPKYRFPEFKNDGEWILEQFEKVYFFLVTNSFSRENLNYENGSVKNIHYGDIHTKFSTLFDITKEKVPFINSDISIEKIREECYCKEGDLIFADASEDLNDVGKSIEIIYLNNEKLVSGLHTLLARQIESKLTIGFAGYLFKTDWVRKQIQREAQGAKVLGISASRISNVKISYPENPKEQKKIVSCLLSLDDLITAQGNKIEQLKLHKKGLMQGLFPKVID